MVKKAKRHAHAGHEGHRHTKDKCIHPDGKTHKRRAKRR